MNPLLVEVLSNIVILLLAFVLVALFQKGFFWPYIRVRLSFGKYVLVKIREINRDLYRVGTIEENTLIYKAGKDKKRITLPKDKPIFYKTIGVSMIDVDSETNSVCTIDYEPVSGFDAIKHENLYVRALTKPQITDNKEKIIFVLLIAAVAISAFIAYNMVKQGQDIVILKDTVANLNKGLITATKGI